MKKVLMVLLMVGSFTGCLETPAETPSSSEQPSQSANDFSNPNLWNYTNWGSATHTENKSSVTYSSPDANSTLEVSSKNHATGSNFTTSATLDIAANSQTQSNVVFDFSSDQSTSIQLFIISDNSGVKYFLTEVSNGVNTAIVSSQNKIQISNTVTLSVARYETGDVALSINGHVYNFTGYPNHVGYYGSFSGLGNITLSKFNIIGATF